jgi:hypothetical protein
MSFFTFSKQWMYNNILFIGQNHYHQRGGNALHYFSIFFCLVMFYEQRKWGLMTIENLWIIYSMYIDFIQSFLFNHWIKINFDSKWTFSSKMLCKFLNFFLVFKIAKKCYQDFNFLCIIIFVIHHFFWKWLTFSVFWLTLENFPYVATFDSWIVTTNHYNVIA